MIASKVMSILSRSWLKKSLVFASIIYLIPSMAYAGGFNGSGSYLRYFNWANDKANGIDITASRFDTEDGGFATGLSSCIVKDGQQTTTARIPFAVGLSFAGSSGVAPTGDLTSGIFSPSSGQLDIKSVGTIVGSFTSTGLNNAAIGATTSSTALFSTATIGTLNLNTATITGGTINGTTIGATTSSTALFSTATVGTLNSASVALTGGTINGTTLGATTSSTALFSTATIGTANIKGGAINATSIGATTPSTALFTTTTVTTLGVTGAVTATGFSAGTVASNSYLGLNSSNQVVLGAGGALTLIASGATGNVSSFVLDNTKFTSAFTNYVLMLDNYQTPATGPNNLEIQLSSNNGGTLLTSLYVNTGCSIKSSSSLGCATPQPATTFVDLFGGTAGIATNALQGGAGSIYFYNPLGAQKHAVDWKIEAYDSGGNVWADSGHALQGTTTTINYAKLLSDTSTFSANYRLYGYQ